MRVIQYTGRSLCARQKNRTRNLLLGCLLIVFAGCSENGGQAGSDSSTEYTYGKSVSFAGSGQGAKYQVSGWSSAEPQFTWTEGDTAVMAVRVPPTDTAVALKMMAAGFTNPPELTAQPVEVFVNDKKIADWEVSRPAEQTAMIPPEMVKEGGLLTFTFKMPKATSPKSAGVSEDARVLGLSVYSFELRKVG